MPTKNTSNEQLQAEIERLVERQESLGYCRTRERLIICLHAKLAGIQDYALV